MLLGRAWLVLGFSVLIGCGGTFTREGEQAGAGGSAAGGAGAGSGARGGYGSSAGNVSYGGGGYGSSAGNVSYGGGGAYGGGGSCGRTAPASAPYPVDFVFTTNTPVYIRQDCTLDYDLYGCTGASPLVRSAACVSDCNAKPSGCTTCGQCPNGVTRVDPGAPVKDSWGGRIYTYGTLPSGCACATGVNAAPGSYTIMVSAFLSEADALANTHAYVHQVQFQLPAPNGVVPVDLGFQPL